ncbi:MAG: hypothetical protein HY669_03290 [Chloroflexi bacterium]|nr:hypothetical protein [Chloroflexota bacterium]
MKMEFDRINISVKDLDQGIEKFSKLFSTTFEKIAFTGPGVKLVPSEQGDPFHPQGVLLNPPAVSPIGLMLMPARAGEKEGIRSISFKVPDLEKAKAEAKALGIRHLMDAYWPGGLKEAVFSADDVHGVRLCLVEYSKPVSSLAEAMRGPR